MSEERSIRIVVNGQEYHSLNEMPPDVRALYERAMGLAAGETQGASPAAAAPPSPTDAPGHITIKRVVTSRKFVVNGKEYTSLDELPPEIAEKVKKAEAEALGSGASEATTSAKPQTSRIPNFNFHDRPRVRVRVSGLRLVLWLAAILLIILLYMRRH